MNLRGLDALQLSVLREPMVRVVAITHNPPLRYLSVSKGGQLTVWNSSLHIQKTLRLTGDPTDEVANTRRFRGWTTDAVYMEDARKVAIATDRRDLHFINVSRGSVFQDVHLYGFRSVPTSLCYYQDVQSPGRPSPSLLLVGDERGGVHILSFLDPSTGLFHKPSKKDDSIQRIYFSDLSKHDHTMSYRHIPNVHQEPINRVMFDSQAGVIVTSSESDDTSVVCMNVSLRQEPYVWKVKQGVKCLDYDVSLQLIVTGGYDRTVRLWSRFVTSRAVATLLGHRTTVLDVAFYPPLGQIFSYSRDADLRVWDITTHHCLRSVSLPFPCLQPGRIPEHGNFPFLLLCPPLPADTRPHLLVGCKDYLALLSLAERQTGGGGGRLCCSLYSPTLRRVVTGHADSSVTLWDVETGLRCLTICNAHGEEEISCMALDSSHKRLITAAQNGTIKVWNLLNGLNLHKLEPISDSKVTGVVCLHDNKLLTVGWSQRIAQYDIAGAKDLYVKADMSWKSRGVHRSDILAVCQCSVMEVIATASHDGEVIVWRLDTQGPLVHLQVDAQDGVVPPVDGLLFLQRRAGDRKLRNRGVLVSSQAGWLCFWSISTHTHTYGRFYAPQQPGERVLSLSTDQTKNNILVSGDTTGRLQVWDISSYALDAPHEAAPPLLRCWKAHQGALLCVEVLEAADALFVLAASAEGSAGLWTLDGDHVGSFGQETQWSIAEPQTYQGETRSFPGKGEDGDGDGGGTGRGKAKQVKGQASDLDGQGQTLQEEWCSEDMVSPALPNHGEGPRKKDRTPINSPRRNNLRNPL
ncbi:cilia- and flagella-associated protein 337 [Genypterus blacodes]|uniref:cilia- and flagella-associated protein 337 n=1 Tax=Genypterus blacodes TaxID=154954 RepID=UPI003F76B615